MRQYRAFFDGSCWPNPNGHAACGAYVELANGERVWEHSEYLGCKDTTNNVAEYAGLIAILKFTAQLENLSEIAIFGDSDLVIKQMTGVWKAGTLTKAERKGKIPIKPRHYLPFYEEARRLLSAQEHVITFKWIPREENIDADFLSTKPLRDRGLREVFCWGSPRAINEELDREFEHSIRS